jgi:hypothetical protein
MGGLNAVKEKDELDGKEALCMETEPNGEINDQALWMDMKPDSRK